MRRVLLYAAGGVAIAGAAYWGYSKLRGWMGSGGASGGQGTAFALGQAIAQAASDTVAGAVVGLGKAFGLPETDVDRGIDALRAGNILDASLYLPAGTFLGATAFDFLNPGAGLASNEYSPGPGLIAAKPPPQTSDVLSVWEIDEYDHGASWAAQMAGMATTPAGAVTGRTVSRGF